MSLEIAQTIAASIPMLNHIDRLELIEAGYSTDEKYTLWEVGEPKYLLRVCGVEHRERRKSDFEILFIHRDRGVACPRPYQFGVTDDGEWCYSLLGFIKGKDAKQVLPTLSEEEQLDIGIQAGRELWRLNQLPISGRSFDWPGHRRSKHDRNIKRARELRLTFPQQQVVDDYILAKLDLLDSAPVRFQHDDYHPANLIVRDRNLAGVVDFNRCDWGDPVEDFYKVPWFTVPISKPFARGQVKGYFESGTPTSFWKRYNLYVAMSITSSLIWATERFPKRVSMFQRLTEQILHTHDFVGGGAPDWMCVDSEFG